MYSLFFLLHNFLNGIDIIINYQIQQIYKKEESKTYKRDYWRWHKLFPKQYQEGIGIPKSQKFAKVTPTKFEPCEDKRDSQISWEIKKVRDRSWWKYHLDQSRQGRNQSSSSCRGSQHFQRLCWLFFDKKPSHRRKWFLNG